GNGGARHRPLRRARGLRSRRAREEAPGVGEFLGTPPGTRSALVARRRGRPVPVVPSPHAGPGLLPAARGGRAGRGLVRGGAAVLRRRRRRTPDPAVLHEPPAGPHRTGNRPPRRTPRRGERRDGPSRVRLAPVGL
ncbi:MAG: hypothetical protein AVDCRST_MAG22-3890, partial [uncultured Rubrobacteraceae bacterium]